MVDQSVKAGLNTTIIGFGADQKRFLVLPDVAHHEFLVDATAIDEHF